MLTQMFHAKRAEENNHTPDKRENGGPYDDRMTQRLTLVREQHDQKERQYGREWN
jgi:hypothetical protein